MITVVLFIVAAARDVATLSLIAAIRCYQWTLSPIVGNQCRYEPTCSAYAIGAIRRYGPLYGCVKTAGRLLRCHPWGGAGWDPP